MNIAQLVLMFTLLVSLLPWQSPGRSSSARPQNVYAAGKSNPKQKDSDHDFVSDWDELNVFHSNPRRKDTDRDGVIDGFEYSRKKHRLMKDQREKFDKDPDNDGLTNEEEAYWGTNSKDSDSDDDGIVDGNEDADGDGIANEDEDDRPGAAASREDLDDAGGVLPTATPIAPTATPTSGPTATPTATATPGPCFDEDLRTQCFGIPSGFTGKVSDGAVIWDNICSACHGATPIPAHSFQQLSTALSTVNDMLGLNLSTQQRADATAFLNRP